MKLKPSDFRKIVVGSFLAVPALSSLISTIHIVTFFGLGNMPWMAIILALAFEIGSIASLMTLAVLDKVNRFAVWFIFFVLVVMQMLGNVYYTYDFISQSMLSNPQWINSFIDLVEMMTMQKLDPRMSKFILSLLIGLPIPVISLAFLKSVSDYLKPEEKTEAIETPVKEEPKEEPKEELKEEKIEEQEEVVEDSEISSEVKTTEELPSEEVETISEDETPKTPFIRINQIVVQPTTETQTDVIEQEELTIENESTIEESSIREIIEEVPNVENVESKSQDIVEATASETIEEEVLDITNTEELTQTEETKVEVEIEEDVISEEVLEEVEESFESIEALNTEDIYESDVISTEERIIQDIIEESETEVEESNSENEQDEKKN